MLSLARASSRAPVRQVVLCASSRAPAPQVIWRASRRATTARDSDGEIPLNRNIPKDLRMFHDHIRSGALDKARQVVYELKELGHDIDAFPYTVLMKAHAEREEFPQVEELWQEMKANHIRPHEMTYEIVLDALRLTGRRADITAIIEKELEASPKPRFS